MRRREFIKGIATSATAAWPLATRAQQAGGTKRIGMLMPITAEDPLTQACEVVFFQELQQLGWTDGRNVRIDIRRTAGNVENISKYGAELVALRPDVILAIGSSTVGPLLQITRTIPIVFASVPDPVATPATAPARAPPRPAPAPVPSTATAHSSPAITPAASPPLHVRQIIEAGAGSRRKREDRCRLGSSGTTRKN